MCAITAVTTSARLEQVQAARPERFFHVGIAEGCAVSTAAGMAKQGAIPVFAVYSSFLQRAYDMLIHDVAIDKLHAGCGPGRTGGGRRDPPRRVRRGLFRQRPRYTVLAPSSYAEPEGMLEQAVLHAGRPVAIRYPRGGEGAYRGDAGPGHAAVLRRGDDITLVSYGILINDVLEAGGASGGEGIQAEVVKLNVITPLDRKLDWSR